jgi:hypothetical protein
MNVRHQLTALLVIPVIALAAACGSAATTGTADSTTTSTESTTDSSSADDTSESTADATTDTASDTATDRGAPGAGGSAGGGPGGVDVSAVTTEDELIALVQDAYGDPSLDLHRGHQPVEEVLDAVLGISHAELHVRMDAGQGLAEVADELGVGHEALIEAMVEAWSPAVDAVLASGAITEAEADEYRAALEEAFTFRVTWDGEAATPTFSGLDA